MKLAQKLGSSEDIRVQRTRQVLQRALLQLTAEKGFAAVTVSDIIKQARVNRSTFYRHYLDKYDLLNKYLDELQIQVFEAAQHAEQTNPNTPEKAPSGLWLLLKHIEENAEFYRIMLGEKGDQAFTLRFRGLSERRYQHVFSQLDKTKRQKSYSNELKLNYIASATVGAIRWWLENSRPISAEQLALGLRQFSMTVAEITLQPLDPSAP